MKKETRSIFYDEELHIEAYELSGIVQSFPLHFHEHYVIGLIDEGKRIMTCNGREYHLEPGDIVLFNPHMNHMCMQEENEHLYYKGINVPVKSMEGVIDDIFHEEDFDLPSFISPVVRDEELAMYIVKLFDLITTASSNQESFEKEEIYLMLMRNLLEQYCEKLDVGDKLFNKEVDLAAAFIEKNYARHISLDEICEYVCVSKSTLIRAFTKSRGITPYRYLETVRINNAKKLLESGLNSVDVAFQTGFTDQSHFTNYFTQLLGVTPGAYRNIFKQKSKGDENGFK